MRFIIEICQVQSRQGHTTGLVKRYDDRHLFYLHAFLQSIQPPKQTASMDPNKCLEVVLQQQSVLP